MSRRILLADDSVTIQKVIDLTFSEKGFEVAAASDGSSAIALLQNFKPDLVITDVHMPGASGFEVCRRTKELYPGVPVMLLVGTFEPFEEAEAAAVGAEVFVKKPFDDQELLRLAGELLAKTGGVANSPADAPASAPESVNFPESQALPAYPELEEEVDLESWDKLEIATETADDAAAEPVWGNFDDALSAVSADDSSPAPYPFEVTAPATDLWSPEPEAQMPVAPPVAAVAVSETVLFDIPALRQTAPPPPAQLAVEPAGAAIAEAPKAEGFSLSDQDIERIARRVAELISEKTVREIAWEILPDVAELVVRDRIKELEAEVEAAAV